VLSIERSRGDQKLSNCNRSTSSGLKDLKIRGEGLGREGKDFSSVALGLALHLCYNQEDRESIEGGWIRIHGLYNRECNYMKDSVVKGVKKKKKAKCGLSVAQRRDL